MTTLYVRDDAGFREAQQTEVIMHAKMLLTRRYRKGARVGTPEELARFLGVRLAHLEHEVFGAIFLDSRYRIIAIDELFRGTLDIAHVYPREVVKETLTRNAAAL